MRVRVKVRVRVRVRVPLQVVFLIVQSVDREKGVPTCMSDVLALWKLISGKFVHVGIEIEPVVHRQVVLVPAIEGIIGNLCNHTVIRSRHAGRLMVVGLGAGTCNRMRTTSNPRLARWTGKCCVLTLHLRFHAPFKACSIHMPPRLPFTTALLALSLLPLVRTELRTATALHAPSLPPPMRTERTATALLALSLLPLVRTELRTATALLALSLPPPVRTFDVTCRL